MSETESSRLRRRLVRDLQRQGFVRSDPVRDAFLAVPRERFLPELAAREGLAAVYRDDAIPTRRDARGLVISSSSQPAIMAEMLERLELAPGLRVLEIGAGTGYNAALLAELVGPAGSVTTVDVDEEIARGARTALRSGGHLVRVAVADGRDGYPAAAPYDRIVVTASAGDVPRAWREQLVEGGLVEVPLRLRSGGGQVVATLRNKRGRLVSVAVVPGGFMPLRGAGEGSPEGPPPTLVASDATGAGAAAPLAQLAGPALATLSRTAKRRLLALALSPPRRRPLGLRADAGPLTLHLLFALPPGRTVFLWPAAGLGLISRDGRSLAYLARSAAGRRIATILAHGGPTAEEELAAAVARWAARGRPGGEALRITVDHDRHGPVPRVRR